MPVLQNHSTLFHELLWDMHGVTCTTYHPGILF